jgi:ElaB/YqjD/DUF883 family membrane-anchored ribosome-binding protein
MAKKKTKNIEKQAEEFVKKELPKAQKKMDRGMEELEAYIQREPLQAVTAAFIIGVFVGKVMK